VHLEIVYKQATHPQLAFTIALLSYEE